MPCLACFYLLHRNAGELSPATMEEEPGSDFEKPQGVMRTCLTRDPLLALQSGAGLS